MIPRVEIAHQPRLVVKHVFDIRVQLALASMSFFLRIWAREDDEDIFNIHPNLLLLLRVPSMILNQEFDALE
jgi:hypothetical protein